MSSFESPERKDAPSRKPSQHPQEQAQGLRKASPSPVMPDSPQARLAAQLEGAAPPTPQQKLIDMLQGKMPPSPQQKLIEKLDPGQAAYDTLRFYRDKHTNIYRLWRNHYRDRISYADFQKMNTHFDIDHPAEGQEVHVPTAPKKDSGPPLEALKAEPKTVEADATRREHHLPHHDALAREAGEQGYDPSVLKEFNDPKDRYTDQRDNDFDESGVFTRYTKRIHGDNTCNVTTLAMQLKKLAQGDEEALNGAALRILRDKGYTGDTQHLKGAQLEDLLIRIFKQLGDDYFKDKVDIPPSHTHGPHQYAAALNHVGALFKDYVTSTDLRSHILTKKQYLEEVKPLLDKGAAVMLSTYLTRAGHIIYLKAINDDGIVVHDPYGLRMTSGYVKNNDSINDFYKKRINFDSNTYNKRLKMNNSLKKQVDRLIKTDTKGNFSNKLGESIFFDWEDVKTYSIGKWVTIIKN